jgi:hypothetical protein
MQKSTAFTTIFRVKKCHFHYDMQNSYLFNEFVCNFGFFWHEWTSLKLE